MTQTTATIKMWAAKMLTSKKHQIERDIMKKNICKDIIFKKHSLTKQFKIMVLLNRSNSIKVSNIKSTVSWLSYIAFILHLIYDYTMQFTAGLLMQDIKCIGCNLDSVTTLTPADCPHVNASIFFMFCFDPRYKNAHIQHPSPSQ